jgi:SAM-dependent methyltransferase
MATVSFYGVEQARIHHERFGRLAAWAARDLLEDLAAAGHHDGVVVDLGCGSGILARALTDDGYAVLGADISADMVALARQTAPAADLRVASAYDLELPTGCVAVTAIGEVLNYGTDARAGTTALEALGRRVFDALRPGGIFVFDVSGPGRAGGSKRAVQFHRHDDWCLGMVATESADERTLDREITVFTADPDGRYRRVDEHHTLRLYRRAEVEALLARAGFDVSVAEDYRSPEDRAHLAGWFVVTARKPVQVSGR